MSYLSCSGSTVYLAVFNRTVSREKFLNTHRRCRYSNKTEFRDLICFLWVFSIIEEEKSTAFVFVTPLWQNLVGSVVEPDPNCDLPQFEHLF